MNNCKNCNNPIIPSKKFCNSSCAAIYNNKKFPKRTKGREIPKCLNCGNDIKTDSYIRYNRMYCSNKCQASLTHSKVMERVKNEDWLGWSDQTIHSNSKAYLIELYGNKCMKCNWSEVNRWTGKIPIELNHIDGNPNNKSLTNLEILCPNCHSLSEFTKSRGSGRKWRNTKSK